MRSVVGLCVFDCAQRDDSLTRCTISDRLCWLTAMIADRLCWLTAK